MNPEPRRPLTRYLKVLCGALLLALCVAELSTLADAQERVLWRQRLDGYSLGREAVVGPDGAIYTSDLNRLYAFEPDGTLRWTVDGVGLGRPVTFGADGTIYTGGDLVAAINPDGTLKWQFVNPRPGLDLAAGPNVGPDGNIYAAQDTTPDESLALGVFALDPNGNLIWSTGTEYPAINLRGPSYTDIQFAADRMYVTVYRRLSRPPSIRTYDYEGDLLWYSGDLGLAIGSGPTLDATGQLICIHTQLDLQSITPDGEVSWTATHPGSGSFLLQPEIASDGTIYLGDWQGIDWWAVNPDGSTKWVGPTIYNMLHGYSLTPDETELIAFGTDTFGVPGWVRSYDANDGTPGWQIDMPTEEGKLHFPGGRASYSADGNTAYFASYFNGDSDYGYLYAINIGDPIPIPGITDCQGVDGENVLTVNGDTGAGSDFKLPVAIFEPLDLGIVKPSGGGNGKFVVHLDAGAPTSDTITPLPFALGNMCHPLMIPPFGTGAPVSVWNNIGKVSRLGSSNYFGTTVPDPARAPTTFHSSPGGDFVNLPVGSVWTLQAIIINPNGSAGKPASVTNAIQMTMF